MLAVAAAQDTRSCRCLGSKTPRGTPPTPWLARPMRCRPEATLVGASIWMTRSTAPMSIPSSSDEVATIALRSPLLSRSSIAVRFSRASEPWWARATSSPGAPRSLSAAARRSARRRLLTNTMVDRCAWTSSATRALRPRQRLERDRVVDAAASVPSPPGAGPSAALSDIGAIASTVSSSFLRAPASTIVTGRGTPRSSPPGSGPLPRAAAAWRSGRSAAGAAPRRVGAPRAARATAPGALRACSGRGHGSRRR